MPCLGNGNDHCCYIKFKECKYVIRDYTDENGHFRKFACSLRAELGDWDKVLSDPRWIRDIEGSWAEGLNCKEWPDGEGVNWGTCKHCGANL